jgi:diacylglycerol kinase (ATP)
MKRAHVIGNPQAGRGSMDKHWDEVLGRLRDGGLEVTGEVTQGAGHAVELASAARRAGADLVVAAGGDGTVHEVVNGLLADGADAGVPVLGVVPLGSGCDYAKTFELPTDVGAAVGRLLSDLPAVAVDVGEVRCRRGEAETVRYFDRAGSGCEGEPHAACSRPGDVFRGLLDQPAALRAAFREHPDG